MYFFCFNKFDQLKMHKHLFKYYLNVNLRISNTKKYIFIKQILKKYKLHYIMINISLIYMYIYIYMLIISEINLIQIY